MYLILVIGATGQGKTPFIKNYIGDNNNCIIYDLQNEYGSKVKEGSNGKIMNLPSDNNLSRSRYVPLGIGINHLDTFINLCSKKKNTICVFEDATVFFQGAIDAKMRNLVFAKEHTRNTYILTFHAIRRVPPSLLEASNMVILFRTGETLDKVQAKDYRLVKPFVKLRTNPKIQSLKIKMI